MEKAIKRGDVFWADLPDMGNSIQAGTRPVVVVSNNAANEHSPVITVCPLTSKLTKHQLPTHVRVFGVTNNTQSLVLCEQVRSVAKSQLRTKICSFKEPLMERINKAVRVQLALL